MDCFSEQKRGVPSLRIPPPKLEKNSLSRLWSTVVAGGRSNSRNENLDVYSQTIVRDDSQLNPEPQHEIRDESFYTTNNFRGKFHNISVTDAQLELVKIELPLLRFVTLAKGREFFEKNKLEHQTFEYGIENIISILTRAYVPAYAHFDKREKDATKSIYRAFIKGTSQIFSILAGDIDKTSSIPLAKFIIISICFGIDRAIFAYKDMDLMWKNLEHEWEDLHLTVQVKGPNICLKLPHLPEIWDIFDHFFRDIRYNSFFYQKRLLSRRGRKCKRKKLFSHNQLVLVLIEVILHHWGITLLFLNK